MSEENPKTSDAPASSPSADGDPPKPAAAKAAAKVGLLHRVHLDPATGLGLFVPGLFVMAVGGAATWHWIFNIGEGVMLLGMTYFVAAVALTALQQRSEAKSSGRPSGGQHSGGQHSGPATPQAG